MKFILVSEGYNESACPKPGTECCMCRGDCYGTTEREVPLQEFVTEAQKVIKEAGRLDINDLESWGSLDYADKVQCWLYDIEDGRFPEKTYRLYVQ